MVRNIRRVLISDPVDPICAQILQQQGLEITSARQWSKEKLLEEIQVCTHDLRQVYISSFSQSFDR